MKNVAVKPIQLFSFAGVFLLQGTLLSNMSTYTHLLRAWFKCQLCGQVYMASWFSNLCYPFPRPWFDIFLNSQFACLLIVIPTQIIKGMGPSSYL